MKTKYVNEIQFSWDRASEELKNIKIRQNFYRDVLIRNGCWGWKKIKEKDGYARIEVDKRKKKPAHIVSWTLHKGEITQGQLVLHKCNNRGCTNPEHLYLGTHEDNMRYMVESNRQAKGSKHGMAKLNEDTVKKIKIKLKCGVKGSELSEEFSVTRAQISNIKNNKHWKHIEV